LTAKKLVITYDISIDLKIINAIVFETKERISINRLRNYLEIHSSRLEEHINNLVRWKMLIDKKPEKNGKTRFISFARPSCECMVELIKLKEAIDMVNDHLIAK
jgi:predicted helicase